MTGLEVALQDFRRLRVWQHAHEQTLTLYRVTKRFPLDERYGLTSQLRRSAASVAANIAEGCGRRAGPDAVRFYEIAASSAIEVEYHLLLAHDVGILSPEVYVGLERAALDVKRMLAGLVRRLRNS